MATNETQKGPLRVMLWSNPRTLSTVFLKCMSFVDGVQAINEPFTLARLTDPESTLVADADMTEVVDKFKSLIKTVEIDQTNAFDDEECTFQWVKDTLEAEYSDKKLVFCKDQAYGIHGRFNMIPKGYRHTFLIRNPYKIYPSWNNINLKVQPLMKMNELPEMIMPKKYGLGELNDLLEYVKENIDPKPIIINADDLQTNPASILRQYCEAVGIPFKESMLSWEAGDKVTDHWIASSSFLRGNKLEMGGYYDEALKSTHFKPPKPSRGRKELPGDVLTCIDAVMPVYEKMYEMRLRP